MFTVNDSMTDVLSALYWLELFPSHLQDLSYSTANPPPPSDIS